VKTNYYLLEDVCPNCGHAKKRLHIGLAMAGWHFGLHVIPEEGLNSLGDWLFRLDRKEPSKKIVTDTGEAVERCDLIAEILNGRPAEVELNWSQEALDLNHAELDDDGLVRSRVCKESHCIGHDGPCDLIEGEFC